MTTITEADVEEAALAWLEGLGWGVAHGPNIAPDTPDAERNDYEQVVLERRLRDGLGELNPGLPAEALDDAFRRLTRPEGATPEARNRAFHRMLVGAVTVEYRAGDGRISGAQVKVIDFDSPAGNNWLAVNQFTVTENRNTRRPDVVLFVNGLPLGVIELKNPAESPATGASGLCGTHRGPARASPWPSTPAPSFGSQRWRTRPSWSLPTATTWTTSFSVRSLAARTFCASRQPRRRVGPICEPSCQ